MRLLVYPQIRPAGIRRIDFSLSLLSYQVHRKLGNSCCIEKWETKKEPKGSFLSRGGGGDRTRVRRRRQSGFYMLSLLSSSHPCRQTSTPYTDEDPLNLRELSGVTPRSCLVEASKECRQANTPRGYSLH